MAEYKYSFDPERRKNQKRPSSIQRDASGHRVGGEVNERGQPMGNPQANNIPIGGNNPYQPTDFKKDLTPKLGDQLKSSDTRSREAQAGSAPTTQGPSATTRAAYSAGNPDNSLVVADAQKLAAKTAPAGLTPGFADQMAGRAASMGAPRSLGLAPHAPAIAPPQPTPIATPAPTPQPPPLARLQIAGQRGTRGGGVVTDTGATAFDYKGNRTLQTTKGTVQEYDPRHDRLRSFRTTPNGGRAVMVDPKYSPDGQPQMAVSSFGGRGLPSSGRIMDETGDRTAEFAKAPLERLHAAGQAQSAPEPAPNPINREAINNTLRAWGREPVGSIAPRPQAVPSAPHAQSTPTPQAPPQPIQPIQPPQDTTKIQGGFNPMTALSEAAARAKSSVNSAIGGVKELASDPANASVAITDAIRDRFESQRQKMAGAAKGAVESLTGFAARRRADIGKAHDARMQIVENTFGGTRDSVMETARNAARSVASPLTAAGGAVAAPFKSAYQRLVEAGRNFPGPNTRAKLGKPPLPKTALTGKGTTAQHKQIGGSY